MPLIFTEDGIVTLPVLPLPDVNSAVLLFLSKISNSKFLFLFVVLELLIPEEVFDDAVLDFVDALLVVLGFSGVAAGAVLGEVFLAVVVAAFFWVAEYISVGRRCAVYNDCESGVHVDFPCWI